MSEIDILTLSIAEKFTRDSVAGAGAIKGAPCEIKSITPITGGKTVTFKWLDSNNVEHTSTMDVMDGQDGEDGKGIASVTINAEEHLIITYTDGSTSDAGEIEVQSAVDSVNGQTGEVFLTASDVNALPDNTTLADLSGDSTHRTVTDAEKTAWNAKSDFSGSYDDLTDKPSIPDEISDLDDTAISSPTNGQVMTYDSGKWKNADNNPTITVDSALSTTSENPVQNKVLTTEINKKAEYEEISWEDYQALSYAEKHNGKQYFVTGAPASAVSASGVSYDNTTSGMTADNVQDALDEIAAGGGQITVDSAMSTTSTNPLQNKVITLEVQDMRASMLNDELKLSAVELAVSHLQTSMLNIDGAVVDGASYDSTNHLILFKHGSTTLFSLDAAAFVKDGMVDTVTITGGNLVITFNTDAGKQAISIPLTDIFDPANYYDKTATDNLLADKADVSDLADYQTKNLTSTIEGETTVEGALGALSSGKVSTGLVPSDASASNKLVAQYTPRSEYSINNSSSNDTWYKVGRYTGGNRPSRLDLISDRVDGQTFESSIRISGVGTNANYVSWIGEDGCENSVNAVQIDSSYNLYIKLMSYSAVRIIAYGNFESFDYEALQSSPSGSNIPLQKLVTESDLTSSVTSGSTAPITSGGVYDYIGSLSGVTQVGDWKLIRLGSSDLYLGLYYHRNITPDIVKYMVPIPDGYSCVQHYFGQCFQEENTAHVTGATHTGGANNYAMTVYFNGRSDGNVYEVRACCLFQKSS